MISLNSCDSSRSALTRGCPPQMHTACSPNVKRARQPIVDEGTPNPPAGMLVLLADSDRHGAELSDFILRAEGYDVEIALTAEDAEAKFAAQDPALSIVELMISGGVGRALCGRLKQRRRTPVLCVSSLDLGEQALAAGADAFLKKPLEPLQLTATVKDLLGQRGVMREGAGAD